MSSTDVMVDTQLCEQRDTYVDGVRRKRKTKAGQIIFNVSTAVSQQATRRGLTRILRANGFVEPCPQTAAHVSVYHAITPHPTDRQANRTTTVVTSNSACTGRARTQTAPDSKAVERADTHDFLSQTIGRNGRPRASRRITHAVQDLIDSSSKTCSIFALWGPR